MFVHYRTKSIILKKVDRGEADQLFTLYTKDFGKIKVLGKSIRKITSKLRVGIERFYLSEIEFIQGKAYKILTDAILIEKFKNLRKDLDRLTVAVKISTALDELVKGQEPDKKIWNLLSEVFRELERVDSKIKNLELIYHYFFWRLLFSLGYKPELYNCPVCQKKLEPEELYFNKEQGGIICKGCFLKEKLGKKVEADIVKILRIILDKSRDTFKLKVKEGQLKALGDISRQYFRDQE